MASAASIDPEKTITHKFGDKIDITNCDALAVVCEKYFTDTTAAFVVFDLENVRLCDSYGLKFLINFQRKAAQTNKKLIMSRPDSILKEMLSTTKLIHIFTVSDV